MANWQDAAVEVFDLQGRTVGSKIVRAIERAARTGKIALDCRGAHFTTGLNLTGATFAQADFSNAHFQHGLRFERAVFEADIAFDRVRCSDLSFAEVKFEGSATFREVKAANLQLRSVDFRRYASFDGAVLGFGTARDVIFATEARFRGLTSKGPLTLQSVGFEGPATLDRVSARELSCPNCRFGGPLEAEGMSIERRLAFEGARFDNTRALKLRADERVSVSGTSFSQSVSLRVESPTFHASAACFERGADVLLQPGGQGDFASASFLGPSLIATMPGGGPPAKISPLDGTRIERLVLQALDLSECTFGRLHRLDGLLISGRGQLSLAPSVVDGSYRREVLADEVVRRSHNLRPMLSWAPVAWNHPAALEEKWPPASSGSIADIYRAMRKAREDSADYPGATDFYYGEMEMRREGADNWVERLLLTGYWVLSGYGMRAARTLAAYVVLVLLIAAGLQAFGLQDPPSFWHTAAWTLTDSISLVRPTEHLDLTAAGMYLNFTIRIIGPALIALIVFALRSRVRR